MKRKDIQLLHQKTAAELMKELTAKRREISKLRLAGNTKKEKNTRLTRNLSDDLARLATILVEKTKERQPLV